MTHTLEGGGGGGTLQENGMTPMVERARHAPKGTVPWQTGVLYLLHSSCLLRRKKKISHRRYSQQSIMIQRYIKS